MASKALVLDYPPAPWTLQGSALTAAFPVRAEAAAALVPAPLSLVSLPGGLAMAFLGVARYGPGSTLEYSELVAGLVVRHGVRVGPYVSHIAVDNQRSQRGGIELWHLPKQLWRFEWELDTEQSTVRVWDGVLLVCTISEAPASARLWPLRLTVPFLQPVGANVALLNAEFALRTNRAPWQLQIGPSGPLTALRPAGPLLTTVARGQVVIPALEITG